MSTARRIPTLVMLLAAPPSLWATVSISLCCPEGELYTRLGAEQEVNRE